MSPPRYRSSAWPSRITKLDNQTHPYPNNQGGSFIIRKTYSSPPSNKLQASPPRLFYQPIDKYSDA